MAIKNIIFDMGRVLKDFDTQKFLNKVGAEGADRQLLQREVYQSASWSRMDRGSRTDLEAWQEMCQNLPQRLHQMAYSLVMEWDEPQQPIEGMEQLVKELKDGGYKLYLLSNASLRQHEYWPRMPVSRYFDGTVISADIKHVKPEKEIYLHLFEKFNLNPAECVFIDDATINIEACDQFGMKGIVFHMDVDELREKLKQLKVL